MATDPRFAARRHPRVTNIAVEDLHRRLESRSASFVLDVRERWEYAEGHVPGAHLLPLGELEERIGELPRDRPMYAICQSGQRSLAAASFLLAQGFSDVSNVDGGTAAWMEKGFSVDR